MNKEKVYEGLAGIVLGLAILGGLYIFFTIFSGKEETAFGIFVMVEGGVLLIGIISFFYGSYLLVRGLFSEKTPLFGYIENVDARRNATALLEEVRGWDSKCVSFEFRSNDDVRMKVNGYVFGEINSKRESFELSYLDDEEVWTTSQIFTVEDINHHKPMLRRSFDREKTHTSKI
jgi:hypothetical protein